MAVNHLLAQKTFKALFTGTLFLVLSSATLAQAAAMPEVCKYSFYKNQQLVQKLAEIAFAEAMKNNIDLSAYHSTIAVQTPSRADRTRKIWAVRFSTHYCNKLGLDGGGFDVEIDPVFLDVIASYISEL